MIYGATGYSGRLITKLRLLVFYAWVFFGTAIVLIEHDSVPCAYNLPDSIALT